MKPLRKPAFDILMAKESEDGDGLSVVQVALLGDARTLLRRSFPTVLY